MKAKLRTKPKVINRELENPSDPENRGVGGLFTNGNVISQLGGRPRGSKDKINLVRDMILDTMLENVNGSDKHYPRTKALIHKLFIDKPESLIQLLGKVLPTNIEFDDSPEYAPVILDSQFALVEDETKKITP